MEAVTLASVSLVSLSGLIPAKTTWNAMAFGSLKQHIVMPYARNNTRRRLSLRNTWRITLEAHFYSDNQVQVAERCFRPYLNPSGGISLMHVMAGSERSQ
jgi:hypothetical protein